MKKEYYRFILSILILSQTGILFSQNGHPLDFLEDWSSGSFDENNWNPDGQNWTIYPQYGNPAPSAAFTGDPPQTNYDIALESYPFLADSLAAGHIFLDFDIRLDDLLSTGTERLFVEVWNWECQEWMAVDTFSNANGSFGWISEHLHITSVAIGQIFKIRFRASGEASLNIQNWIIDNISIYRYCEAPDNLECHINYQLGGVELTWSNPAGFEDQWIQWDDGDNFTSIGTGDPIEFDVAARFTPDQLSQFPYGILKSIAFVPNESEAIYKIRAWSGTGAENLIVDQAVTEPVIGEWNTIDLVPPIYIDITEELWLGYYINTTAGYPAGCDDGPAVDSYGNLMNFGGWQTLLQVNPELDYNWNIKGLIISADTTSESPDHYIVYRSDDINPYFIRQITEVNYFLDDSICPQGLYYHVYVVSACYVEDNDTCQSDLSNEADYWCAMDLKELNLPDLLIYPNPTSDVLMVEYSEEMGLISLYNYNGRTLFRKEIADRTYILPVKDYPEGVYLLRVETGKGVVSRKVVVMR